jgi:AcrR family transcriptional regulator
VPRPRPAPPLATSAIAPTPIAPTATALLDAAERLYAEEGFDAVSIRRIVLAGGQGNLSAAHYHFGSREALIRAVLARRMPGLDAARASRLRAIAASGRDRELRAVVAASIEPLADAVRDAPWGRDYARVLARAMADARMDFPGSIDPGLRPAVAQATAMARALLVHLPEPTFEARIERLQHDSVQAIARWCDAHGPVTAANRRAFRETVADLVECLTAALAAPGRRGPRRAPVD